MNGKQILQSGHSNGASAQLELGLAKSDARRATSVSITRVLAESPNIEVAAPQILQAVGEGLGWAAGRLWTLSPRGDVLSCNATWLEPSISDGDLKAIIEQLHLPSAGKLRDAVMQSGDTQWADLGDEVMGSPAATGRNGVGLGSPCWLLAFPVQGQHLTLGVVEFIGCGTGPSEDDLLATATNLGYQIGQFIELKRAEAYLQRTEERFQAILDNCTVAIYIKDTQGRYVLLNRWHESLLGLGGGEIKGKTDHDILPVHVADLVRAHDTEVLESGKSHVWEEMFLHPDGWHTYISTKFPLRDSNGAATAVCGMSTDITERKQAEDALRAYASQLDKLHQMDTAIMAAQLPDTIARAVLQHIDRLVPCCRASISLPDPESRRLKTLTIDYRRERSISEGTGPTMHRAWDFDMLKQGKMISVGDIAALPDEELPPTLQEMQAAGVRSFVTLPLISHRDLIGSLTICSDAAGAFAFEPTLYDIVHLIADKLTIATQNAILFKQVQSGHEMLQSMSRRLLEVQESERRHTARELHDEIGQALTAVKMNLQFVKRSAATPEVESTLEDSVLIVEQALEQVRSLALNLRPSMLDDLGLASALRWYVDRLMLRSDLVVSLSTRPARLELPPEIEIACFRVVQEALTNVVRHAGARYVRVEVHRKGPDLSLLVRDDGSGFDLQVAREGALSGESLGLLGMQERVELLGGTLQIETSPQEGTLVRARFPVAAPGTHGTRRKRYDAQ